MKNIEFNKVTNFKYVEYGNDKFPVIILLHGGGLSWWSYRFVANKLKNKYHVVVPILDGHADSDCDFISIESNTKKLLDYISHKWDNEIFLIAGLSLGAQILIEMLSMKSDFCKYAVVESALVKPNEFLKSLVKTSISVSYPLIKKEWFAKLQYKALKMPLELFDEYYRDSCKISKENMIKFLEENTIYKLKDTLSNSKARILIMVGSREQKRMIESAKLLHNVFKDSKLVVFEGFYHGQVSINYPDIYIKSIDSFLDNNL